MEASDTEGKKEGCLGGCKDILGLSAAKRKEEEIAAKKADLRKNVVMTEHLQPLGELMAKLNSDPVKGLTQEAADMKLEQDGLNRLTPPPEDPAWLKFIRELTGFFSCLLWFGGALCFIGYALRADKETLYLGIVLCLVVFITGCFSFYQNSKSEDLMKSFKNLLPPQVSVIRSGDIMQMDSSNLVAGDVIRLKAGDLVPADVRIIECSDDMCVDNAALTGEAEPQKRKPICQAHLTDRHALEAANLAFFGTLVPEGSCTGVVIMTGDRTILGRIARLAMSTDDDSQTPIGIEIEAFVQFISGIAIGLGLLFFFIGVAIGTDWISNMIYMIGIIVANVPEGLLATVTMSLTLTSQRMAKRKVLVKNLESVETLGSTSCICSDKTGTLTQNNMTVVQIAYHNNSQFSELDVASSYTRFNKGYDSDCPAFQEFCRCAALCNSAIFDAASKIDLEGNPIPASSIVQTSEGVAGSKFNWKAVGNASECAIIKFIQSDVYDEDDMRARYPLRFCIPFNSTNKFQVNICRCNDIRGSNFILNMKGAPERILDRCDTYFAQDGSIKPLSKELRQQITNVASSLAENGLRVIGFAESLLGLEFSKDYAFNDGSDDGFTSHNFPIGYIRPAVFTVTPKPHPNSLKKLTYLGFVGMIDPPRVGVIEAVAKCKSAGIKVIMVTGDHPLTAEAIAHKVGILWSKTRSQMERENERFDRLPGDDGFQDPDNAKAIVVNGEELDGPEMNQSKWDFVLEHPQIVFARTSPQQKLAIVEQVQKFGHIVAVTGDGVNDSPALKQADIGIAMGISGSEVSKQAADMILLDDNFASIVGGVEQGRRVFDNLKKTIVYVLTSNVPELIPFLAYAVMRIPLALTTVLILAIDLGTDMVPAISMAWEDAEADIMTRPPRNSKVDRLVTSRLVWYAYLQTGLVETLGGFLAWFVILNDYGYPPHILIGLGFGSDWGKAPLYCRTIGGVYVNEAGNVSPLDVPSPLFPLWHDSEDGLVIDCAYPARVIESGVGSRKSFEVDDASSYNQYPLQTEGFSQYSIESIEALEASGYYQYIPYRSRMSPFWRSEWLSFDTSQEEAPGGGLGGALPVIYYGFQPAGVWSVCINNELLENSVSSSDDILSYATYGDFVNIAADANVAFSACDSNDPDVALDSWRNTLKEGHQWTRGVFCNGNNDNTSACEAFDNNALVNVHYCPSGCGLTCLETEEWMNSSRSIDTDSYPQCLNIASRMAQKEALHHSQTGFFVAIVVIQWSNLLVCKTRISSLMSTNLLGNEVMLIGLFFETLLTAWLCYCLPMNIAIGTRNLKFIHWFPGLVWSLILLVYDEGRKFLMRMLAIERVEAATGQIQRSPSWVEKFTYY